MPQGSRHSVRFDGPTAGIALAFDPARFASLVDSAGGKNPAQIVEYLAPSSPRLEHLMRALLYESNQPSTQDQFGLECIATAIALALTQAADKTGTLQRTGTRLAPRQVRAVRRYVEDHLHASVTLAHLANVAGLSSFHFLRAFKQSLGVTPMQYVLDLRIEHAKALLKSHGLTVAEVGIRVGFDHAAHFTRAFRRAVGVTPSSFRYTSQK
jgi:AraC family transcriptional regulator